MPDIRTEELAHLAEQLLRQYKVDFRGYKPTTLTRRVQRRMDATHATSIELYLRYLDEHPEEYPKLLDSLLINVTEFFREPESWGVIRNSVLPMLLSKKRSGDRIRIWSAGCATGEEPYTMAVTLSEAAESMHKRLDARIHATDIDESALSQARLGEYCDDAVGKIPDEIRDKYLVKDAAWTFDERIRKMVICERHDLVNDEPIRQIDLVICRNVLIYMNPDLQHRLLSKFYESLVPQGFLFLGRAESLLAASRLFKTIDERARIFRKS